MVGRARRTRWARRPPDCGRRPRRSMPCQSRVFCTSSSICARQKSVFIQQFSRTLSTSSSSSSGMERRREWNPTAGRFWRGSEITKVQKARPRIVPGVPTSLTSGAPDSRLGRSCERSPPPRRYPPRHRCLPALPTLPVTSPPLPTFPKTCDEHWTSYAPESPAGRCIAAAKIILIRILIPCAPPSPTLGLVALAIFSCARPLSSPSTHYARIKDRQAYLSTRMV